MSNVLNWLDSTGTLGSAIALLIAGLLFLLAEMVKRRHRKQVLDALEKWRDR